MHVAVIFCMFLYIPHFITHLGRYWRSWVCLLRFWSRDSTGL